MSSSPGPLPSFRTPPVAEVVLGVQFVPIAGLHAPLLGLFWSRLREEFPRIEQHPPLEHAVETFGRPVPSKVGVSLQLVDALPAPRFWFINARETELIQVQQDRFIRNWRRQVPENEYPRYGRLRMAFEQDLRRFVEFLAEENLGQVSPDQCEVTYINHLTEPDWQRHGDLGELVTVWSSVGSDDFLSVPEQASFAAQYVILDLSGEPCGRLHCLVEPAYRVPDGQPTYLMRLTARGQPIGEGIAGVLAFLDLSHEWVVRAFTSITTPKMHRLWERNDGC